jgi:hypothetical protein
MSINVVSISNENEVSQPPKRPKFSFSPPDRRRLQELNMRKPHSGPIGLDHFYVGSC